MSYGFPGPGGQQQPPQWGQGQQPPPPSGWQQPPPGPGWQQPGPGWGGPPPRPPKRNTGKIVGLGCAGVFGLLVVIGVVGALASGGDDSSKDSGTVAEQPATKESSAPASKKEAPAEAEPKKPTGPEADVKLSGCEVDATTGWASVQVLITNQSSKESNYIVNVEFVNGSGTRLGEAFTAANNLAPGQKAEEKAQGLDQIKGKIVCKVTEVTRYAS